MSAFAKVSSPLQHVIINGCINNIKHLFAYRYLYGFHYLLDPVNAKNGKKELEYLMDCVTAAEFSNIWTASVITVKCRKDDLSTSHVHLIIALCICLIRCMHEVCMCSLHIHPKLMQRRNRWNPEACSKMWDQYTLHPSLNLKNAIQCSHKFGCELSESTQSFLIKTCRLGKYGKLLVSLPS